MTSSTYSSKASLALKSCAGLIFFCIISVSVVQAQGVVVVPSFSNVQVNSQNDIITFAKLGGPYYFLQKNDSLTVTSDLLPYLLLVIDSTTSTQELQTIDGLRVFPNPVPDILVIQRTDQSEEFIIEVYSSGGMRLHTYSWAAGVGTYQPSFQSYAPGHYVLTVTNAAKTKQSCFKIVKP